MLTYATIRTLNQRPVVRHGLRAGRWALLGAAIILAVALVTTLTIDLGPSVKVYAERYGSQYLERPLHIGRISFRLFTGRFLFEDLVIEGFTPDSPPFLTARRIELTMPWDTLFDRRVVLQSIEMTDWRAQIEVRDGRSSMPRLTPRNRAPQGERRWTTTLQYVHAHRGEFVYQDHGTPWRVVAPNLDITVARPGDEYRGEASFSNGVIAIQDYLPFRADMRSTFKLDGARVVLDRIELETDGASSLVRGDVNLTHWPEQMFRVESTIDFERMRQIFFARESFRLTGTGQFTGYFHLFKEPRADGTSRTGRELFGTFRSVEAGVNAYRFRDLEGAVRWTPDRLAVTDASATAYGGRSQFEYEMSPLGVPGVRATARFGARYQGIDLRRFSDFLELDGLRLAGTAAGRVDLRWPLGRFAERHWKGTLQVRAPSGVEIMTRRVPVELIEQGRLPRGPAAPLAPRIPLPIDADVAFDIDPRTIRLGPSRFATQRTYVEFEGETSAAGDRSRIPFFLSSADWQESYRVFAAMRTALGTPTGTIDIGGYGTFDGVVLENLRRPRIEGTFDAGRMRAWNVTWGSARGRAAIENGYADVAEATLTSGDSRIFADGRFSLGFPRADGGEQLNARVRLERRPVVDLREAFGLSRYPIDGLLSGEFHLFGEYTAPLGYGTLQIADGRAYGESFESVTAQLGLEGNGARLTGIEIRKGGARAYGAAQVGWDGAYSFDVAADAIPVESVTASSQAPLPLSGLIDFTATGSGTFDDPRYTVNVTVRDLFAADEGIGQVVAVLNVVDGTMTLKGDVHSPRLTVGVSGFVELTDTFFSDVTFSVQETSLDPYVRALDPRLSPFTTAVVSGGVRVVGELSVPQSLQVTARVDRLDLRLFDYPLQNPSPFTVVYEKNSVNIAEMVLFGDDTKLRISGVVGLTDERVAMDVVGTANLAVLQGFVRNVRSTGQADLVASLSGPLRDPVVTGRLTMFDGRIRHFGAPNAVEKINGTIAFDSRGVTLDGLTAEIGRGPVQFGGRIDKEGFLPGQLGVTVSGQNMRLRYPEGMQSVIDASLTLQGTVDDMRLGGEVIIEDAQYTRPFPTTLFDFFGTDAPRPAAAPGTTLPLTYDAIRILAASSIRVQNSGDISARLTASADLELRGTYDRPVLSGELELDRAGQITFLGKRYTVTQGTIYFNNPTRIQPTFDVEAESRVRVPGETYNITASVRGPCCDRLSLDFTSDPALPTAEILALVLSDVAPSGDPELRRFNPDADTSQQILQELAARAATGAISSQVSRVFEQALGVDAFRITPSFGDLNVQSSRLEPSARVVLGKRISSRAYLEYSRSLSSSTRDEIITIEFDQSDRTSWILSRNEDQTYALELRWRRSY